MSTPVFDLATLCRLANVDYRSVGGIIFPEKVHNMATDSNSAAFELFRKYLQNQPQGPGANVLSKLNQDVELTKAERQAISNAYVTFTDWVRRELEEAAVVRSPAKQFEKASENIATSDDGGLAVTKKLLDDAQKQRAEAAEFLAKAQQYFNQVAEIKTWETAPTNLNVGLGEVKVGWGKLGKSQYVELGLEAVTQARSAAAELRRQIAEARGSNAFAAWDQLVDYLRQSGSSSDYSAQRKNFQKYANAVGGASEVLRERIGNVQKRMRKCAEALTSWSETHAVHNREKNYIESEEYKQLEEIRKTYHQAEAVAITTGGAAVTGFTGGLGTPIYAAGVAVFLGGQKLLEKVQDIVNIRKKAPTGTAKVKDQIAQVGTGNVKEGRLAEGGVQVGKLTFAAGKLAVGMLKSTAKLIPVVGDTVEVYAEIGEQTMEALDPVVDELEYNRKRIEGAPIGKAVKVSVTGGALPETPHMTPQEAALRATWTNWNYAAASLADIVRAMLCVQSLGLAPDFERAQYQSEDPGTQTFGFSIPVSITVYDSPFKPVLGYDLEVWCTSEGTVRPEWMSLTIPAAMTGPLQASVWGGGSAPYSWNGYVQPAITGVTKSYPHISYLLYCIDYAKSSTLGQEIVTEVGKLADKDRLVYAGIPDGVATLLRANYRD